VSAYTIIALIILVATGGLIAWLGDIIGYRLGKRRSSLFGLRPRTTARVVGIAVGATLPLIGLAVAALGSSYVRDAAFRLQYLRDQEVRLTDQVRNLNAQTNQARTDAESARQEANDLKQQTEGLQEQAATLNQRITSLQAERDELLAKAERIRSDLQEAKSELDQSRAVLSQVRTENQTLEHQRASLREEVDTLEGQLKSTQGQVDVVNRELENKKRELQPVQEELELKLERLDKLQVQLKDLERALRGWEQAVYGPKLFDAGQELLRNVIRSDQTVEQIESSLVIRSDQTVEQIESSLRENLILASKIARASGVEIKEGRAIRVLAPIPEGKRFGEVSESRIIVAVARKIKEGEEDSYIVSMKVLATVFAAQPEPEPVPVMLMVIPNSRVYERGETIVRLQIDGSLSRDKVFAQIWSILSRLRNEAQERGVLAHPETGQYGDVPAEQLLAALDQLLAVGKPQTVRAIAAEDVYRAGLSPFLVAIQVGEESES